MKPALPILMAGALAALPAMAATPIHKIGKVTWHAERYAGQTLELTGFLLTRGDGYVLFSDEAGGKVSAHDLPVTGPGLDGLKRGVRYYLHGVFVKGGLAASNGNPYHFELVEAPGTAKP